MQDNLSMYMDKVRDYYRDKKTKVGQLSTEDVIERILGKPNNLDSKNHEESNIDFAKDTNIDIITNLDLDDLYENRGFNNDNWLISAERAIFSHRKIIGKFIVFGKKVVRKFLRWYIDPITEAQSRLNGSVTRCINEVYNKFIVTEHNFIEINRSYEELNHKIMNIENQVSDSRYTNENVDHVKKVLEGIKNELCEFKEDTNNKLIDLEEKIYHTNDIETKFKYEMSDLRNELAGNLLDYTNKFQDEIKAIEGWVDGRIENKVQETESITTRLESDFSYLAFKIKSLEVNKDKEIINVDKNKEDYSDASNNIEQKGLDYFLFENRFRGSEKEIKKRQRDYLKYFMNKENVLDIGCGRGEFLEILAEEGISAKGIEVYDDFVDYCINKGLDVEKIDAVKYLDEIEDNSLGGIFLGQVVEHLEKDDLLKVFEKSYKKLKSGAYLIAETPNPTMLSTFTNAFYIDPSHIKPIHPETMKFLLQYYGFKEINIKYCEESKINYQLPLLIGDQHIKNLKEFNDGINLLSSILFGYQDYAIIGKK